MTRKSGRDSFKNPLKSFSGFPTTVSLAGRSTSDKTHRSRRNTGSFNSQPEKRVRERQRAGLSGFHGYTSFSLVNCDPISISVHIRFLKGVPLHGQLEPNSLDLETFLSKSQLKIRAPMIESARCGQVIHERTNPCFHRGVSHDRLRQWCESK
jgi:hypothetical protein